MTACILWEGHLDGDGYGHVTVRSTDAPRGQKTRRVHQVAYEEAYGPVPEGFEIDHLCRNRACMNPAHLEAVTHRENVLRGEAPSARNARKTHCIRGHEFTPENTYVYISERRPHGIRFCRACHRERSRRRYHAKKRSR